MKNAFFLAIFIAVLCVTSVYAETSDCYVHRKTKKGEIGMYNWRDHPPGCNDSGVNCKIEPCSDTKKLGSIEKINDGWIVKTKLTEVKLQLLVGNIWATKVLDGANYTFTADEYLVIDDCLDYPELSGVTINLKDISTDENGNYSVFIPKMH